MQFPAVRALDGVSLTFEPGEVHGIVGENGAGKSTLMKILSGVQAATSGSLLLDGETIELHGIRDALKRGIGMIHQELNLVDELTAAGNVFLGREIRKGIVLDEAEMNRLTEQALQEVGASFPPTVRTGSLSVAGKQLVEIAKALAEDASILIMDEPTAVLSDPESEALYALIGRLKAKGVTVVYISHRLAEVCHICDRVSVLRDGQWVTTVDARTASPETLANSMVGRDIADFYPTKGPIAGNETALEALYVTVPGHVTNASFSVRKGEILGLAGLVGSGRTELCEAIFGVREMSGGEVKVFEKPTRIKSPRDAMRQGIAYVSEDRKTLGLVLSLNTVHNTSLASLLRPLLDARREQQRAEHWKETLDIRVGDLFAPVATLSGGNQQKIAVAKWLERGPRILILDEPTRGVDVGAKREIYDLIVKLASEGTAIIVVSSELTEIIGVCHRAVVLREGKVMGEVGGDDMNEQSIMRLAAGVLAA